MTGQLLQTEAMELLPLLFFETCIGRVAIQCSSVRSLPASIMTGQLLQTEVHRAAAMHGRQSKIPSCLDNLPARFKRVYLGFEMKPWALSVVHTCLALTLQTDCGGPADRPLHAQVSSDSNRVSV